MAEVTLPRVSTSYCYIANTSDFTPELSLAEQFSHVTPLNPVASDVHSSLTASSTSSVFISSSASSRPHGGPASGSCVLSSSRGEKKDNALSKQLVLPSDIPVGPMRSQPRARLLTSTAALAILEEKEQKKKQEVEMKEQRKRQREEKKRKKSRRVH